MDYVTRSRRAEHLPHPTRARTVFSRHRQLEGRRPSATDTRPVTPVTSKSHQSIFYSSEPSKQTLSIQGSRRVAELPFHHSSARPSLNRRLGCCFQLQPKTSHQTSPQLSRRNKPRWDERFGSDAGAPHPPHEIETRAPSRAIRKRLGLRQFTKSKRGWITRTRKVARKRLGNSGTCTSIQTPQQPHVSHNVSRDQTPDRHLRPPCAAARLERRRSKRLCHHLGPSEQQQPCHAVI